MASEGMVMTIDDHAWKQAVSAKTHAPETAAQTSAIQGTVFGHTKNTG
jgi:hypothetical protein